MKKILTISGLASLVIWLSSFGSTEISRPPDGSKADSVLTDRKYYVDELRLAIKGKEKLPADSVFKNIKTLKGVPAGRLISIMDKGWANSLGVTCGYCHENDHWDLEIKPTKEITRQMAQMSASINNQLLKNISGLSANAIVNCTTCHRGSVKPAIQLPPPSN